jgi:rhomboid protease GluP
MDTNTILCWLTGVNGLAQFVRVLAAPTAAKRGWVFVLGAVLVLLAVLLVVVPSHAGWAFVPWFVFAVLPQIASAQAARASARGRHRLAGTLHRLAALLHPFDGWRDQVRLAPLFAAERAGDLVEARRLAEDLARTDGAAGGLAFAHLGVLSGDLDGWLARLAAEPRRAALVRDPSVITAWMAALGARGDVAGALRVYAAHALPLEPHLRPASKLALRAAAAAQAGLVELATTSARAAEGGPTAAVALIRARALQRAGRAEEAQALLTELCRVPGLPGFERHLAERSLAGPYAPLDLELLDADAQRVRAELARTAAAEAAFALGGPGEHRPVATRGLALVLASVFGVQLLHGEPTDIDALVLLGALVTPTELVPGAWLRPYSAAFLHFGWWHALLNLLGLLVLGGLLERRWGWRRVLVCYGLAILTSSHAVVALAGPDPAVFVGASGGVMGLLGALLGRLVVGLVRGPSPLLRRQLVGVVAMVALQIAFDATTPIVSSTAHLVGLATGLVVGLVATVRQPRQSPGLSSAAAAPSRSSSSRGE